MAELTFPCAYPALWGVFALIALLMLLHFRRKGWV